MTRRFEWPASVHSARLDGARRRKLQALAAAQGMTESEAIRGRLEDAQAYLNNPGFGGAQVWRFEVEIEDENLLDFTVNERAAWRRIARVLGKSIEQVEDRGQGIVHPFFDNARVAELEALAEAGILWVRYEDTFPVGCTTMRYLGGDVFFAGDNDV